ncbi:MAG TPA: ATP-grasp domain-containing protein [Desulfosporosinus sp.]|nr:ATP-grasp domain-containing protein [Desulfosporosinus sp.]
MVTMDKRLKVLVAGLGGASLGTEIVKSLHRTEHYCIYGCDISAYAYGHFMPECVKTIQIPTEGYIESIIEFCNENAIRFVIPGGEGPLILMNRNRDKLNQAGIIPVMNSEKVIDTCSDKRKTFRVLNDLGFSIPYTIEIEKWQGNIDISFPCIIKPATGTGGSNFVFLAANKEELSMYVQYLLNNGQKVIVQEYIPHQSGEYTIGVLSLTNGTIVGSICLERAFHNKLSIMHKSEVGLISSGYTQGSIKNHPELCDMAERIAKALDSRGPINIQGRIKDGKLVPFEINPRFSASTYLRSLAGFDELDLYFQHLSTGRNEFPPFKVREGYCTRSFTEMFIEKEAFHD